MSRQATDGVIIAFTACIIAITLFVLSIAAAFGAVGSIFTIAGMAMACLAFVAYITACFVAVIEGTMTIDAAMAETKRRTRAYAKRQLTWLRAERNVHWLEAGNPTTFAAAMELI